MIKAFPNPHFRDDGGMDLRDWFAGLAMQGLLTTKQFGLNRSTAQHAYCMADEMMKAREQNDRMEEKTSVPKD